MNFKFKKRNATFEAFKNRPKKEGGDKTITLKVSHSVSPKELDMLVPAQGIPTSTFLFGDNPFKKPALQTYVLFPIAINRHPEGVSIIVYDNKNNPLEFESVDVTDIEIDIDEDGKKMVASYNLQLHPGRYLQRISDYVEGNTLQYECVNTQEELFGEEAPEQPQQTDLDPNDPPPITDGDPFSGSDTEEDDD